MNSSEDPRIERGIPTNAVSIYSQDNALDDFPVLKAFQQYVDAEQARARKRLVMISVFFGCLMFIVISVFVAMLLNISRRNQDLSDRLIEFAMKDRERPATVNPPPVVVQQTPPQDNNSALLAITEKFQALQKQMEERTARAESVANQAVAQIQKPQKTEQKSAEARREIERLKALLAAEQEKNRAEREERRKSELEEYRRKHYPDLYRPKESHQEKLKTIKQARRLRTDEDNDEDPDIEIESILNDSDAISYFDTEDDDETAVPAERPTVKENPRKNTPVGGKNVETSPKQSSIPMKNKGSSGRWSIPNE